MKLLREDSLIHASQRLHAQLFDLDLQILQLPCDREFSTRLIQSYSVYEMPVFADRFDMVLDLIRLLLECHAKCLTLEHNVYVTRFCSVKLFDCRYLQ